MVPKNLNPNGEWKLCIEDTQTGNAGTLNSWELTFSAPPCHTVGFHGLPETLDCDEAYIRLQADDSAVAIGYDYPALIFQFRTDENAANDNYVRVYSDGEIIFENTEPIQPNWVYTVFPPGPGVSPSSKYTIEMFEGTGDGGFDWLIYDGNSTTYNSGSYPAEMTGWWMAPGEYSPQGITTWTGAAMQWSFDNGFAYLDPAYVTQNQGLGPYDIEYCFDNEGEGDYYCYGCATHSVEIINPYDANWTSPGILCETDEPINLNALVTGTPGGTWSGEGVSGSLFDPAGLGGEYVVSYKVGPFVLCNAQLAQLIKVQEPPQANAGTDAHIADDQTFTVTTATAFHYSSLLWTTSGTGTFSDNGLLTPTYYPGEEDIASGEVKLTLTAYPIETCEDEASDEMMLTMSEEGINDLALVNLIIEIYPNPSEGEFTLAISKIDRELEFSISSYDGKLLYEDMIDSEQTKYSKAIDISAFQSGTYFLRITDGRSLRVEKIVLK